MMMPSSKSTRMIVGVVAFLAVFLAMRLPGIHLPYHQDEWKNVSAASTIESAGNFYAHPPFMQMIFVADYKIFGMNNFRMLPLLFSLGAAVLLYFVMKRRVGESTALWAVGLFALCFYNVLGALQPDVDGAILPFLFLLAVYFYDSWTATKAKKYFVFMAVVLLAGFLFKLSFILVVGTLILDYLLADGFTGGFSAWFKPLLMKVSKAGLYLVGFVAVYIGLLYFIQAIYPAFSISFMLGHASGYGGAAGRNWTQIIVQTVKAFYYLSPLMLVPLLFVSKDILKKTRVFGLYLVLGLTFFLVLFDFSQAALDKYLMFAIVPIAAISGAVLANIFNSMNWSTNRKVFLGGLIAGLVIALLIVRANFIPQEVVALYPKTAWFSRVLHGHWNVLTPFNGGSGPLGFYISFLFIAASYITALVTAVAAFFKKSWRPAAALIIIVVGIFYNGVFAEELFHGGINGSAPALLSQTVAFIAQDKAITKVLTYNDIGSGPLSLIGKYAGRIYATPESESGYRKKFSEFDGQYLIIDIPRFDPAGFYFKFFAQCKPLFQSKSGKITGTVYDCPHDAVTMSKI